MFEFLPTAKFLEFLFILNGKTHLRKRKRILGFLFELIKEENNLVKFWEIIFHLIVLREEKKKF